MPAEAHRLHQPIRVRDRRLIRAICIAAALAVATVIALPAAGRGGGGPPPARAGCIRATVAGVMGGGVIAGCGGRAQALCRTYAHDYVAVAAQCAILTRRPSAAP